MDSTTLWRRVIKAKYGSILGGAGGRGGGLLVACTSLMGLVYGSISGKGGMVFIILSFLRWWMALVLNFGMMHGVRGFRENLNH